MTLSTVIRPKGIPRPGRNDPCWCGSREKYKKCHRDSDEEDEKEEFGAELATSHPQHPNHPICESYFARPSKVPANLRADFNRLLNSMRTSGGTLLHVQAPQMLALEQKDYDAVLSKLADYGITPHFPADPTPEELIVANAYVERIFGPGAYRIVPASRSLKSYPLPWSRSLDDGVYELGAPEVEGLGSTLYRCKLHETKRVVEPALPDLIVDSYAISQLLRDLVYECRDLAAELQVDDGDNWGGLQGILTAPCLAAAGDLEALTWVEGLTAMTFRIALGLAFPNCRDESSAPEIDRLAVSPGAKALLNQAAAAMRADPSAMDLLPSSRELLTPAQLKAWQAEVHERLSRSNSHLTSKIGLVAEPVPDARAEGETGAAAASAPAPAPSLYHAVVDLFTGFNEASRVSEERDSQIREEIQAQGEAAALLAGEVRDLSSRLKQVEDDKDVAENRLKELEETARSEIERARTAQAEALVEALRQGARSMSDAPELSMTTVETLLSAPRDAEQARLATLVQSYEHSLRDGKLEGLPAPLRATLEAETEHARRALGLNATPEAAIAPLINLPLVFAVDIESDQIRVGVALPFDGCRTDALRPATVEAAVAAMGVGVLTTMIHDHGSDDSRARVTATCLEGGISLVWISAVMSRTEVAGADSPHDEQQYLQLLCDGPAQHLRSIGVEVAPLVIPADLMDELSQVGE